jgi:chromosome partitioning protein
MPEPAYENGRKLTRTLKILLSSPKGGSGKTELSKNLAVAAACAEFDVALVDFDQQRTSTNWLSLRPAEASKIHPYEGDLGLEEDVEQVAALADHDLVFIDTPPSIEATPKALKTLVLAADFIIVPTRFGKSDLDSNIPWARMLGKYGKPYLVVLNAIKSSSKNRIKLARHRVSAAADLCPVEVSDFDDYLTAAEAGLGVAELRGAKGADDISALWAVISRHLNI